MVSTIEELKKRIYNKAISQATVADIFKDVDEAARRAPNDHQDIEFMNFAVLFLDRLFGEAVTCCKELPEGWQSIKYGGWLHEISTFYSSQLFKELPDVRSFGTVRFDPIIEKLYSFIQERLDMNSNMMGVLSQGRLFLAPIEFLTSRVKWLSSKNTADTYWYNFVQNSDIVHSTLLNWIRKHDVSAVVDGNIRLPPLEYFLFCLVRYPFIQFTTPAAISLSKSLQDSVFIRPLSADISCRARTKLSLTPYSVVLYKYIRDLFPRSSGPSLSEESKLFLCLAVEYWIGTGLIVRRDHSKFEQRIVQIQSGTSYSDEFSLSHSVHPNATDVIFLSDAHRPSWAQLTLECIYLLLWHLLNDPSVPAVVSAANKVAKSKDKEKLQSLELVSPALSYLQQPLFDMLRIYFNGEKQSNLLLVVDIWLLYIQPWSLVSDKQLHPIETNDTYDQSWKYYIAANLHFYTTVFTCFMRFAAKMSGSWELSETDGQIVFSALIKVLKVFSNESLRNDIIALQKDAKEKSAFYNRNLQSNQISGLIELPLLSSPRATPRSPNRINKGFFNEPPMNVNIEAVFKQHYLFFPDSRIDELVNMGLGDYESDVKDYADKIVHVLRVLYSRADIGFLQIISKTISEYASEIGIIPLSAPNHYTKENIDLALELVSKFTDVKSERQLLLDPLDKPITSYEINKLAFLCIRLSKLLNKIFGLPYVKSTATWDWQMIWRHSLGWWDDWQGQAKYLSTEDVTPEEDLNIYKSQINILSWFRFNLRFLSSHTSLLVYGMWLFYRYGALMFPMLFVSYVVLSVVYFFFGPSWIDQFGYVGILKVFYYNEEDTGILTDKEREEILLGVKDIDRERLRYRGDPIDLPYFSNECTSLVDFLVKLSKQLNKKYQLPKEPQTSTWSNIQMMKYALKYRHKENPFVFCCRCFRFNLRFLASVQQVGYTLELVAIGLYFLSFIGLRMLFGASIVSAFLYYICPDL